MGAREADCHIDVGIIAHFLFVVNLGETFVFFALHVLSDVSSLRLVRQGVITTNLPVSFLRCAFIIVSDLT